MPKGINTLEFNTSENAGVDQGALRIKCTEELMYAKVQPFRSATLEHAVDNASAQEINIVITFTSWDSDISCCTLLTFSCDNVVF